MMMETVSGLTIDPLDIDPKLVNIEDIAWSLSRQCRYGGHSYGHLSVARHSLWVADRVGLNNPELELAALLHDAAEAYLGDVVSPLKHTRAMAPYRKAEKRAEKVIANVFGLPYPMPPEVHAADKWVTEHIERDYRNHYWGTFDIDRWGFLARYNKTRL